MALSMYGVFCDQCPLFSSNYASGVQSVKCALTDELINNCTFNCVGSCDKTSCTTLEC